MLDRYGMDAPGPMSPSYAPSGLTPVRGYRWCLLRTLRDLQQSVVRRRVITLPNLLRLMERRWRRVAPTCHPPPSKPDMQILAKRGKQVLHRMYMNGQPFTYFIPERHDVFGASR